MTRLTAAPTGFGIGVCALFCAVLPVTAQDNSAGGTLATFSFGQSFVYSDEPSQRSSVTEEFSARTDLGFNLNSRTQRSDIDLDLSTALQSGVGDSQDFDFVDPEARLRYNITSRNSRLGLRATYAEADVNALDDDLDVTDQDLTFGQGKRQTTGYFLNFDTGLEAPFGLGLRASRIERRFSDTTDPDLIDTLNETYSIEGRFRISPVMQMTAGLEQSFYEGDDALETDRETRTTSLGVNYQLRPDLTADASLFYTQNDNTTLTGTESNDGLGFSVNVSKELPNGLIGAGLQSQETLNGRELTATVNREIVGVSSFLALSFGAVQREENGIEPLINVDYQRDLPRGALTVGASQAIRLNTDSQDVINSNVNVGYSEQINEVSRWGINFLIDDQNALDTQTDSRRFDFSVDYRHEVTRDWNMVARYSYVTLQDDGRDDRSSNEISIGLERQFQFRP